MTTFRSGLLKKAEEMMKCSPCQIDGVNFWLQLSGEAIRGTWEATDPPTPPKKKLALPQNCPKLEYSMEKWKI